jgi:hypothetical protein
LMKPGSAISTASTTHKAAAASSRALGCSATWRGFCLWGFGSHVAAVRTKSPCAGFRRLGNGFVARAHGATVCQGGGQDDRRSFLKKSQDFAGPTAALCGSDHPADAAAR